MNVITDEMVDKNSDLYKQAVQGVDNTLVDQAVGPDVTVLDKLKAGLDELAQRYYCKNEIEERRKVWDSELAQGFKTLNVSGLKGFKSPVAKDTDWMDYKKGGGKVCIPRKTRREASKGAK